MEQNHFVNTWVIGLTYTEDLMINKGYDFDINKVIKIIIMEG